MTEMSNGTISTIPLVSREAYEASLKLLGWGTPARWAKSRGYNPATVRLTLKTWAGRNRRPHGGLGREILAALERDIREQRRNPETLESRAS